MMMNRKFDVIYDFDQSLYGSSTILEDRYIIAKHIKSGREKEFRNITDFQGRGRTPETLGGWLKEQNNERGTNFKADDFEIIQKVRRNHVPFSKAQEYVRSSAESVREKDWCGTIKFVIGGKDNYRMKLNKGYKSQRPPKPLAYKELREWFINEYRDEVIVAEGCEADDILSIYGWWGFNKALRSGNYLDNNICLVFIDKDILQVPAFGWNPKQKLENPIWQTEFKAGKSFWTQMQMGDAVDAIPGLKGVGIKTALKNISDCDTIEEMEERVLELYKETYGKNWRTKFQETYQMVKLMTTKDEIPTYRFNKDEKINKES